MSRPALRRTLHVATAGVLLLPLVTSWGLFRGVVVGVATIALAVDTARILRPPLHRRLAAMVPVFRDAERSRLSGATWLWLGYAMAVWAPNPGPAAGILVAALADPAAALVGERFRPGNGKSWQGTAAAAAVALVVLTALGLPREAVLAGAVVGTLLERWPGPLDDNLLVPPAVAAVVAVLA